VWLGCHRDLGQTGFLGSIVIGYPVGDRFHHGLAGAVQNIGGHFHLGCFLAQCYQALNSLVLHLYHGILDILGSKQPCSDATGSN